jgi:CRP-like cAMP-binding protein
VDEGLLKASVTDPEGDERILAMLGPGAVVGELSMLDGAPRSASVIALRDSGVSFISVRAAIDPILMRLHTMTAAFSDFAAYFIRQHLAPVGVHTCAMRPVPTLMGYAGRPGSLSF